MEFKWKIMSTDDILHTMTVAYWTEDRPDQMQFNIPMPPVGADISTHIAQYAPLGAWSRVDTPIEYQTVSVGIEGTATPVPVVVTEMPPATIPAPEVIVTPMPTIEIQKVVV